MYNTCYTLSIGEDKNKLPEPYLSRYVRPAWDFDKWSKTWHPPCKNRVCAALVSDMSRAIGLRRKEELSRERQRQKQEQYQERLRQNPLLALPFCWRCYKHLAKEMFYPEGGPCRECRERYWEQMQRMATEYRDVCLFTAIQRFSYWRAHASRDELSYSIVRRKRMEVANFQCEHCGAKEKLSMHHITYERIFNEHLDDVRILCSPCHGKADAERRRLEKQGALGHPLLLQTIKEHWAKHPMRSKKRTRKSVRK